LVWWYLHAQHVAKRRRPLTVVGPAGLERRFKQAAEALFPDSLRAVTKFEMCFIEQEAGERLKLAQAGLAVTPFDVSHPSGASSHALRIEVDGRTIAFSGDTEWVDALVPCARGADLFMCECYAFDQPSRYHMSWTTLAGRLPELCAKRVVLTHMNASMLRNAASVASASPGVELAHDGMVIEL
jgi:ribonuclease BN (tRNA processing enzyme)